MPSQISAKQIKAARAILEWSQDTLAETSGVSIATVRKVESGYTSPRESTNDQIKSALEEGGIEFISPNGVREQPKEIQVFEGHLGIREFFDDIYQASLKKDPHIVMLCKSEEPFRKSVGFFHIERMIAIKGQITVRCILTEDNTRTDCTEYCTYKYMPNDFVDFVPFYIYDDKYAVITFNKELYPKITVIKSSSIANAYRKQFDTIWDKAIPLKSKKMK